MLAAKEAIANLEYFCKSTYNRDADTVIDDLKKVDEQKIYVFLNKFVDFMLTDHIDIPTKKSHLNAKENFLKKKKPATVRGYFSFVRSYLRSRGLRTHLEDIKEFVVLPTRLKYEFKSLTIEELRLIVSCASPQRKALYLTLIGSGMRIGEAVQIRKENIDIELDPAEIRIPAANTKTKTARTTYLSSEAKPWVLPIMNRISEGDLVFGTNQDTRKAVFNELRYFERIRNNLGLVERYESNRHRVTIHAIRAYTATKAAKARDENFAHGLIGHTKYLGQYIRFSREELAQMYRELEPDLYIFDTSKKDHEITLLKNKKSELEQQIPSMIEFAVERIKKELVSEGWIKKQEK